MLLLVVDKFRIQSIIDYSLLCLKGFNNKNNINEGLRAPLF